MAVLQGQKDVALFTEAASIFHHNDLRIFPFCQPDELNSVRVSGKPHTFFFFGTRSHWRKTLNISATSSFIFWKNGVSFAFFEGVAVRRSLTFKIGFRIMNGGSWTQQHTTNERTQRTNSNFQRSFQPSLRPKIGMVKDMVATTRHLL